MKIKIKFAAMLLSTALTASYGSMNAMAVDDSYYYYDVKKASDYALTFCWADPYLGEGEAYEKYYTPQTNTDYINLKDLESANCTNYISQILYYGGYKMRGTPESDKLSKCGSKSPEKWFYYCLEDNWGTENDVWSASWVTVDKNMMAIQEQGIYHYFTGDFGNNQIYKSLNEEYSSYLCSYEKKIKYCEDFAEKYNLKRGDIVQIDYQGTGWQYDHTLYVWCTEPEIRFCSNSSDYFGKLFSKIHEDYPKAYYRIIHTTDHAIVKSAW